jgi:hypothetical protein
LKFTAMLSRWHNDERGNCFQGRGKQQKKGARYNIKRETVKETIVFLKKTKHLKIYLKIQRNSDILRKILNIIKISKLVENR